jgi:Tol biopolymer transport system component
MKRIAFVVVAVMLAAGGPAAQDLERLFKLAVNTETVDRDLRAAIEQYRKVAEGGNRALAAQALLRMAECYRQLGDAEAQRVYERILREFSDQPEAVALARTRLAGRPAPVRAEGDRLVKSGPDTTYGDGRVSPDGRYISYVSYDDPKGLNLMLHDLATGTDRAITDVDWNGGAAYDSTFSPDGKRLAYGWRTYGPPAHVNELRMVVLGTSGFPEPRTIHTSDEIDNFSPTDWSSDGRTLAVRVRRKDGTDQIALIGVDGSFKSLKTVEGWRSPDRLFFSPDGKYLAYDLPAGDADLRRDVFIIATDASGETAIPEPSHDVVMGWSPDGRHLLVASDRNGDVGLWALPVAGGKPAGTPSLLRADIGSVQSQGLTASGTLYLVKDVSTLSFQVAPIDLTRGRVTGPPTLQTFRSGPPAWSPDGTRLAYTVRSPGGVPHLAIRSIESGRVQELHPRLSYMPHPRWFPDGKSLIVWGRDIKGSGVIVRIDVETGREAFITAASDIQAVQVSPDGTKIYYHVDYFTGSTRPGRVIERELATGTERDISVRGDSGRSLPGRGAPARSSEAGTMVTIQIDRRAAQSTVTLTPAGAGEPRVITLPAIVESNDSISWTSDRRALLVASNADSRGRPHQRLWLVPLDGDPPRELDIDISTWVIGSIRLSPDGRHVAFFTGEDAREVWALETVEASIR